MLHEVNNRKQFDVTLHFPRLLLSSGIQWHWFYRWLSRVKISMVTLIELYLKFLFFSSERLDIYIKCVLFCYIFFNCLLPLGFGVDSTSFYICFLFNSFPVITEQCSLFLVNIFTSLTIIFFSFVKLFVTQFFLVSLFFNLAGWL